METPVKKSDVENGKNSNDKIIGIHISKAVPAPILICLMSTIINKGKVKKICKIDKRIIEINPNGQLKRLLI